MSYGIGLGFGVDTAIQAAAATQLSSLKVNGPNALNSLVNQAISNIATVGSSLVGSASTTPTASPNDARDVLGAINGRDDPLMNFRWYCDLPNMPDGTQLDWSFVEECNLPVPEFEVVSNYRAGRNLHYVGKFNLPGLSLKLYEDSKGRASSYCRSWRNAIFDSRTGTYQVPGINGSGYKQTVKVTVLDVTNLTAMIFTYSGCWPTRTSAIQLSSGNSERVILEMELQADDLLLTVTNASDPTGLSTYMAGSMDQSFSSAGSLFQNSV